MKRKMNNSPRQKKESAPFPSPKLILFLVIFSAVAFTSYRLGLYTVNNSDLFVLKQIKIEGNRYLSDSEILRMVKVAPGKRMFEIELDSVVQHTRSNLYIEGVGVSRSLPSTLLITIQERQPVANLVDKEIYMVDKNGKILLKKPAMSIKNLPLITGLTVKELLQKRGPLLESLAMIKKISEVDQNMFQFISEIHMSAKEPPCIYLIKGGAKVELGQANLSQKIYALSEYFKRPDFYSQLANIKKINLNFADRIVVTRKS